MIKNQLLVTDGGEIKNEVLLSFFDLLKKNNFKLKYLGENPLLLESQEFDSKELFQWTRYRNFFIGKLFYWLSSLYHLPILLAKLKKEKIETVITTGYSDTLLVSILNKLIKFKHIWLLLPEMEELVFSAKPCKKLGKKISILTFSSLAKDRISQQINSSSISILPPLYIQGANKHQDNIFSTLAKQEHPKRKFFTVGTFTELTRRSNLEALLKAAKEVREVVPNLQVIIVGDGPEKKNLLWLAKTLGIETTVWFVGPTEQTFKWLENLDIYIHTKIDRSLKDQVFALEVMDRKLPIIADIGAGLDDLVFEKKTGNLVIFKNTSELAEAIINLEQDQKIKEQMGEESKRRVAKLFSPEKVLDQFAKVL